MSYQLFKERLNTQEVSELESPRLLKPKSIKAYLDEHIIEQEHAKKVMSVAIYNHYKRIEQLEIEDFFEEDEDVTLSKGNILMVGPTGVGKTALAECIADFLDVPFVVKDATCLTSAGYVGEDVESIIKALWEVADRNVESTEKGIIVIDEIDKIARRGASAASGRDVGGEGVQQSLLKLIEGTTVNIQANGSYQPRNELIQIDTSNILFILCGAFVGLDQIIQQRTSPGTIGFGAQRAKVEEVKNEETPLDQMHTEDLMRYGLIPEFMGRLPVLVHLNQLSEDALCEILWKPKNALVRQYQKLLEFDQVKLTFTDESFRAIVKKAIERKSGARGLRSVIESLMVDIMYDIPDQPNVIECIITEEVVINQSAPILKLKEESA
jgi:ATP-dependent Clp protease ATP-binding subunit ClpX